MEMFYQDKKRGNAGQKKKNNLTKLISAMGNGRDAYDADWDQWPDQHCKKIIEELEARQVEPEIIHAIASHGPNYFGVEPESRMDKMLYAFDELSGLIHAYSYAPQWLRRDGS